VYPIYTALARQCGLRDGSYPAGANPEPWRDTKTRERDLCWLDEVDGQVQAVHLRQFLATPAVAREEGLRAFLGRHLLKPGKQIADRDKIDLLVVQYFVLCAPPDLIAARVEFIDIARILRPVLGEVEAASLECCEPLDRVLETAQKCHSLREMVEQGLMEQGRIVKEAAEGRFYDPVALVSFCRFNFVLRRTFIQLLHADLRAIGAALNELERRGLKTVDCRRAALSAAEPLAKLRQFHQHWKAPLRSDYNQGSSFGPYEQLMCLREDLEEALGVVPSSTGLTPAIIAAKSGGSGHGTKTKAAGSSKSTDGSELALLFSKLEESTPSVKPPAVAAPDTQHPGQAISNAASKNAALSQDQKASNIVVTDAETLEEKIWEQLIATPPVRGRSMTTVTVEETRVLLSAWEVAAFISASGPDSDDLRHVIVARAMLSTALERGKRLLDFETLQQAVAHARKEIPRLQERIDHLKRTGKTDSAINLGISLKRLLSLVDEAGQLHKENSAQDRKR
jgi:hypothetical protein